MISPHTSRPCFLRLPVCNPAERRWLLQTGRCSHIRFRSDVPPKAESSSKRYSDTLLLPKTSFPVRHKNVVAAEEKIREEVTTEYYKRQWENNEGPVFILHDGPPYANGNLHMGHALNKLLKDFINRYKAKKGYRVKYIPGWDCHGLPIEHKALKSLGKSHLALSPQAVRKAARKTALDAIEVQKSEFRQLGIMADWDSEGSTYRTLDPAFEIRQLKILRKMVQKGLIQHRRRPTYYSPSSRTALAEAELSYRDDHISHSVYVFFEVPLGGMSRTLRRKVEKLAGKGTVGLAIWTTTPWTLTANQAVAVARDLEYALVRQEGSERVLIIARDRVSTLERHLGSLEILEELSGEELLGTSYRHLFWRDGLAVPQVIASKYVTVSAGTGLVHSAPGHGQEDYEVYREAFSDRPEADEIRCPVNDEGNLTDEILQWTAEGVDGRSLVGKPVLGDAVPEVVQLLKQQGILLAEEVIQHRYPCDWKTKEPIIIRATPQWFADVGAIKEDAINALKDVHFKPESSRKRLESFVLGRSEWCISRQRSWGVPIPIIYEIDTDQPVMSIASIDHIINVLSEKGTDHWWSEDVATFLTSDMASSGKQYRKGTDTMDVWFDSGSSWTLIDEMKLKPEGETVADVYLEGSDQHRGWFQSSLLTSVATSDRSGNAKAPYTNLVTHGFVLDQDGQKMSKSAGNGLTPVEIIHGGKDRSKLPSYGTDILRLWAAAVDYTGDSSIGSTSLSAAAEKMRKIRNVMKFLLGNSIKQGANVKGIQEVSLSLIDRYVLHETVALARSADQYYQNLDFNPVLQAVNNFMASTLSAFYFDLSKDVLYSDAESSPRREAIVAVMVSVCRTLKDILAPLTPHLVHEIESHLGDAAAGSALEASTYLSAAVQIQPLLEIRQQVLQLLEEARTNKQIGNASEAALVIGIPTSHLAFMSNIEDHKDLLPLLFGTSDVVFQVAQEEESIASSWSYSRRCEFIDPQTEASIPVSLTIKPSSAHKCPRCWRHVAERAEELCGRCHTVIHTTL